LAALLWENIGVHGSSLETGTGTRRVVTSAGPMPSPLRFSPGRLSPSMTLTTALNTMATTQASLKDGRKDPARMPRPTAFSEGCMTSQRRQEPVSTPDVTVASAWPRGHYPLPPKQHKQRRDGGQHVLHAGQLEAGTGRQRGGLLRSSRSARPLVASKPYWPEKTERIDESYQLHMSVPDLRRTVSPARLRCPASERLLRWRPLLPTHASPSSEDLDKRYQLTALAWEPSTLMSYTSRLLVFPHLGRLKELAGGTARSSVP
jgi:hypothetical protein